MVTKSSCDSLHSSGYNEDVQDEDTVSVATSEASESSDASSGRCNTLALVDDINKDKPSFGNIAVTNSTDIHFGNKTYYQGPVTIKQFLYATPQISRDSECDVCDEGGVDNKLEVKTDSPVLDNLNRDSVGKDNPSFVPDCIGIKINNIDKKIVNTETTHAEVRKSSQWLQNFTRRHLILLISLSAVLLVSLVTLLSVLLTRHSTTDSDVIRPPPEDSDEQQSGSPAEYPLDPSVNLTLPGKLKIVTRREWLAQPAADKVNPLQHPVPYVIIMHTATENCSDQGTCTFHVRFIQSFHIDSRNWSDIGYNFLVGGDGYAYEGRGWTGEGAHTYGYNARSIGIAFVGTFNQIMPPDRQIIAAKQVIEIGVNKGYISKTYKLLAARQLQTTQSPGLLLYEDMKKWPHWAAAP